MLAEALAFPRADDDWLVTVLIGGVLTLLGFLVLPVVLVNGYLLRVLAAAVTGEETPPRFSDWVDLFVDGLLVIVVQFVYVGVPSFVLSLLVAVAFGFGTVGPTLGVLLVLAVGGVVLAAVYLLPAALANFARTGNLADAFDLRTVARAALTTDYALAVVLAIAVSVVLGFIGGLLLVVLVGAFVLFYVQVVAYHLFGQGFARGIGLEAPAEEPVRTAG